VLGHAAREINLDAPTRCGPVLVLPGEEAHVVRERDLAMARSDDDSRPVGVVLGHGVAVDGHEHMFA